MKLNLSIFTLFIGAIVFGQSAPSYYSNIDFTKRGNALKSELTTLITRTHQREINYYELKELMKTSDVDPDNPNNLLLIYGSESTGKHQRSRAINDKSWNREHVYAKSKGTPNLGTSGPGADGHHLRPADIDLNQDRGNLLFDDGNGVRAGRTSRGGWYPGDEWKGDVARILMYMYVRYGNRARPLNITFGPSTYAQDFPDILLKWNVEDPVSEFEKKRNNVVANTQKNRNPFIDNPYLATLIWNGPAAQNTWPDTINDGGVEDTKAPSIPNDLVVTDTTASSITFTWNQSTDNYSVSGYNVYLNGVFNKKVYTNSVTITGLNPKTEYNLSVSAFDVSKNESGKSAFIKATTLENNGGGNNGASSGIEDFENIPSSASNYGNREWTNNGINWTATNARTDQSIDNDKAICIRGGKLKSTEISGGISSLTIKTQLKFSGSAGEYTLLINGEEKGKIHYSKDVETHTINDINVAGDFVIELVDNTRNRVAFDDLSWTNYSNLGTNDEVDTTKENVIVYPNPIKNNEFYLKGLNEVQDLEVYGINGQLVQRIKNVKNNQKVRLNTATKGVYFIKTETQTIKVIVD